jgi:non-ribosomal peptide synthase protein (TIGR01720 family)
LRGAVGHRNPAHEVVRERLVAFYVGTIGEGAPHREDLRRFAAAQLPSHMIPAQFVAVPELPLLPNGKVDRQALAGRTITPAPPERAPTVSSDAMLMRLLDIWRETLGTNTATADDDFFDAGGDSILAIQLISRAARAGVRLSLSEFFQAPTVRGMAETARARGAHPNADHTIAAENAAVPLTPIQHWFLERGFVDPDRWNHIVSLRIPRAADHGRLQEALGAVIGHHDALRLALDRKAGGWQQLVKPPGDRVEAPFIDLLPLSGAARSEVIAAETANVHASIRLDRGLLLGAVRFGAWFSTDGSAPASSDTRGDDLLYLAAHHLAVDAVSWHVLIEDLENAYQQLARGTRVKLPPVPVSFRQWAHLLHVDAQQPAVRAEAEWWAEMQHAPLPALPRDFAHDAPNDESSAATVDCALDEAETERLTEHARRQRVDVRDVLLAGIALCLRGWTGRAVSRIGVETHGRAGLRDVDVSRTVGWFTTYFPIVLDIGADTGFDATVRRVSGQMKAIPNGGLAFGLLRYMTIDSTTTRRLSGGTDPEVIVNYLGRAGLASAVGPALGAVVHETGQLRHPHANRASVFEINAAIVDGRLKIVWTYSRNLHRRETVADRAETLLRELRVWLPHEASKMGAVTASDFPDADLDDEDVAKLLDRFQERGRSQHADIDDRE